MKVLIVGSIPVQKAQELIRYIVLRAMPESVRSQNVYRSEQWNLKN